MLVTAFAGLTTSLSDDPRSQGKGGSGGRAVPRSQGKGASDVRGRALSPPCAGQGFLDTTHLPMVLKKSRIVDDARYSQTVDRLEARAFTAGSATGTNGA